MSEIRVRHVADGEIICGERASSCHCSLPPNHDGPHHCQRDGCGGMWTGRWASGDFRVVRFPANELADELYGRMITPDGAA